MSITNHGVLPFQTDKGIGLRGNIALVALEYDQTIEHEFYRLTVELGMGVYCTRIRSLPEVTPEVLGKMEDEIINCVSMLPPGVNINVAAFACTSAALVIGEQRVAEKIQQVHPGAHVTDPFTAASAALKHLGARRIGLLTPYIPEVASLIQTRLEDQGFEVVSVGSFCESADSIVAKIDLESIKAAMKTVGSNETCDAIFMSCTSLRSIDIIDELEQELGIPITTSTHALAWHALRLCGQTSHNPVGALMRST
ncbi:maleate cis-trans isomerase family protein [Kordiimonas pumila]|uniref:Aspartate/glutamate racemase family protein n=1 Tax=Kordiimonas pumila TaxID=2161677 RepID=A0ABV7D3Y2_9PROT|nr:aspartate/glutamate racemase family protein [Kordiimonas pumila]